MSTGIDKLVDFLIDCIQCFQFWAVIHVYEKGVKLRLGNVKRDVCSTDGWRGTGLHWCLPFYIDRILVDNVVTRTHRLGAQNLTTRDGKAINITAMVTANIRHIRKALLEVENMDHALADSCTAAVCEHVAAHDWDQLRIENRTDKLSKACREQAWRYGIEIERVQLVDLGLTRSINLHTGAGLAPNMAP